MVTSSERSRHTQIRALVAAQDPEARERIMARLASLACECEHASDGVTAWHAIMSNSFDLALIDLDMPDLDSGELIRCARNHPRTRHMPLVVMTSNADKTAIEDVLSAGATSFLTKPINWTTFAAHVGYLLKLSTTLVEARKEIKHLEATSRVKDAVLDNVLTGGRAHTRAILDVAEDLLQSMGASNPSRQANEALRRLTQRAQDLNALVAKASQATDAIPQSVSVDDELVPVASVCEQLHKATATTAAAHEVEIVFIKSADAPMIRCNRRAIVEALTQLTVNAIKHSRPGQAVRVNSQIDGDGYVAFHVSDSGAGMTTGLVAEAPPQDDDLDVFDELAAAEPQGSGFGLAIAKAIAEAHGGSLKLHSVVGQGTTAELSIPPDRVLYYDEDAA